MKVLVTFAVDWEFKPWLRLRSFDAVPGNDCVFRARVDEEKINVVLTGIGQANALRSIHNVMDGIPDLCIISGLAGGLKLAHRPGEILAARAVRSEGSGETICSDQSLLNTAVDCGAKAVEHFVSASRVIRSVQEKSRLSASADAVDMESFHIMKELGGLGVPCVAVRSVSDPAETKVPYDFERALDSSGRIRIVQVLGQVAADPRQVLPLARFAVRSSRAAASLARFLDSYVAHLARHKETMDLSVQHIS